jgi:hypothetical protein
VVVVPMLIAWILCLIIFSIFVGTAAAARHCQSILDKLEALRACCAGKKQA